MFFGVDKTQIKVIFSCFILTDCPLHCTLSHRERYVWPFLASWVGLWCITSVISSDSFCFSFYQMMATSAPWPSGWSETSTSPQGVSFFMTPSDTWYKISQELSEGVSLSFGQSSQTGRWTDGILLVTGQVTMKCWWHHFIPGLVSPWHLNVKKTLSCSTQTE